MKRIIISMLLLASLLGCGIILYHANFIREYAEVNFLNNADLIAHRMWLVLNASFYTGIGMILSCVLEMATPWKQWRGVRSVMWVLTLIILLLGTVLIKDSTKMIQAFKTLAREDVSHVNVGADVTKIGTMLWQDNAATHEGPRVVPDYVMSLFSQKAKVGVIALGLLLLANLLWRQDATRAIQ